MENRLKRSWQNDQIALALFIGFPAVPMTEMAAMNGFDVIVFDNEHGTFTHQDLEHMTMAAELHGVTPLVRVVSHDAEEILKALDRGAHGIHVPQVETAEQAQHIVQAAKYPPAGRRGAAFSMRAAQYGTKPVGRYLEEANRETLVCVHIESARAVENVEEIVRVPGIDAVYIGPTDLSVSMGLNGQTDHPEVLASADRVLRIAHQHGVRVGMHVKDSAGAKNRVQWGADYVGLTVTSLINQSFSAFCKDVIGHQR